ncbi:hypothetical protein JBE04_01795 [Streptomyces sp. PRKS01-29]|nr:hypothetical protein [Streptomyces sabulosicollis]MBI0293260.1 hypothetical protein [Streptomyces sabulosicollis]
MSDAARPAAALSADEVNEAIRRLLVRAGGRLSLPEDRAEYARLVAAWAAAQRRDVTAAA